MRVARDALSSPSVCVRANEVALDKSNAREIYGLLDRLASFKNPFFSVPPDDLSVNGQFIDLTL